MAKSLAPWWLLLAVVGCVLAFGTYRARADLVHVDAIAGEGHANTDVLEDAIAGFRKAAERWTHAGQEAAAQLFWTLATISLVWTGIQLALRQAELGEIAREIVQFMMVTGFWGWMMKNAPEHAKDIMTGMVELGRRMTGTEAKDASSILDVGFELLNRTLEASEWYENPIPFLLGLAVVLILAVVAANMIQVLVAGWLIAYGGIVVLGFGGARWTSDIAINYYRTCLGFGLSALATILLVGVGESFMETLIESASPTVTGHEEAVVLAGAVILAFLVTKVPAQIGALATGGGLQHGMGAHFSGLLPFQMLHNATIRPTVGAAMHMAGSTVANDITRGPFGGQDGGDPHGPGGSPGGGGNHPGSPGSGGQAPAAGSAFGPLGAEPTIDRRGDGRQYGIDIGTSGDKAAAAEAFDAKMEQLMEASTAVELTPEEAALAGAFTEDAVGETEALNSRGIELPSPAADTDKRSAAARAPGADAGAPAPKAHDSQRTAGDAGASVHPQGSHGPANTPEPLDAARPAPGPLHASPAQPALLPPPHMAPQASGHTAMEPAAVVADVAPLPVASQTRAAPTPGSPAWTEPPAAQPAAPVGDPLAPPPPRAPGPAPNSTPAPPPVEGQPAGHDRPAERLSAEALRAEVEAFRDRE